MKAFLHYWVYYIPFLCNFSCLMGRFSDWISFYASNLRLEHGFTRDAGKFLSLGRVNEEWIPHYWAVRSLFLGHCLSPILQVWTK